MMYGKIYFGNEPEEGGTRIEFDAERAKDAIRALSPCAPGDLGKLAIIGLAAGLDARGRVSKERKETVLIGRDR